MKRSLFPFFGIIFLFSACRFVVPSNSEVSSMGKSGTFSGGAPTWAKLPKGQNTSLPESSGIIPQNFTVPESVSVSSVANASSSTDANIGRGIEIEDKSNLNQQSKIPERGLNSTEKSDKSPLAKLEKECPGSEEAAVEALKTEEVGPRIKKYLILTKRCPGSADVWVWLAKDYKSVNRLSDAKRCVQAALALDADNKEAKELLIQLGEQE